MNPSSLRRRLWWVLVMVLPMGSVAGVSSGGPARNLQVQWRVVAAQERQQDQQGLRAGEVVIDSRRGVSGRAVVTWSSRSASDQQQYDGQLMVLNGAWARLNLMRSQPLLQWQWVSPRWVAGQEPAASPPHAATEAGAGGDVAGKVALTTTWVDRGQGLAIKPHWPGGHAPVEVELQADVWQAGTSTGLGSSVYAPDGQDMGSQTRLQTTLVLPMDTWVTVAQSGGQAQAASSRTGLYSTDTRSQENQWLQIRVSQP